jgi:hypothetical protein
MQSGKATRKTTMEAKKSRPKVAEKLVVASFVEIMFMRRPLTESALFEQAWNAAYRPIPGFLA